MCVKYLGKKCILFARECMTQTTTAFLLLIWYIRRGWADWFWSWISARDAPYRDHQTRISKRTNPCCASSGFSVFHSSKSSRSVLVNSCQISMERDSSCLTFGFSTFAKQISVTSNQTCQDLTIEGFQRLLATQLSVSLSGSAASSNHSSTWAT